MTPYDKHANPTPAWSLTAATIDAGSEDALDDVVGMLGPAESGRYARLRRAEDRLLFRAAHGVARLAVARAHGVPVHEVALEYRVSGQPLARVGGTEVCVSWAHCEGAVACLSGPGACGVDVERLADLDDVLDLAGTALHEAEQADLLALPASERSLRFLQSWTLKEAMAKTLGEGFTGERGRLLLREAGFRPTAAGIECRNVGRVAAGPVAAASEMLGAHHLMGLVLAAVQPVAAASEAPVPVGRSSGVVAGGDQLTDLAASLRELPALVARPLEALAPVVAVSLPPTSVGQRGISTRPGSLCRANGVSLGG